MQLINKFLLRISALGILFVLFAQNSFAQYPDMAAFRAQQNAAFVNQMMRMNMFNYNDPNFNLSYTFVVTMKDGTKKEFYSAIYNDTVLNKNYLLLTDKSFKRSETNRYKKIYPSQTLSISRNTAIQVDVVHKNATIPQPMYFVGNAVDSCWMFKVISGPINAYSSFSERKDDFLFKPFSIVGIQLNDGAILRYTTENIKKIIAQDPDAMKYFDKKKYLKAIDRYNSDVVKGTIK